MVFARPLQARVAAQAASMSGASLVVASLVISRFPGSTFIPLALPAVVGSMMLIWVAPGARAMVSIALGLRGPVFIGLISYSLYLWHWPLIVLLQYWLVNEPTTTQLIAQVVTIFGLALLSWRFVEQPSRKRTFAARRLVIFCVAGASVLVAAALALLATSGLPQRLPPEAARINAAAGTNYRCPISDYLLIGASRGCKLALPSGAPADADVVLLGNSHAQMYAPMVADILQAHGLHGLLVPANGCLPMTDVNISAECVPIAEANIAAVEQLRHARVVLLGLTWTRETDVLVDRFGKVSTEQSPLAIARGLANTVTRLQSHGKRVVVIGPLEIPGWDVASELSRSLAFGRQIAAPLSIPDSRFDQDFGPALASLGQVAIIRPDLVQCRAGQCDFLRDGESLFADSNHLAVAALPRFRGIFEPAIVAAVNAAR